MAAAPGDGDRQRTDRGGLVDHHQQRPVDGELVEQRPQLRFAVGQRPIVQPLSGPVQAHGVVLALANVQAEEYPETAVHPPCRSFVVGGHRSGIERRHPRYDETYPAGGRVPISGPSMPPGPVTPPPGSCVRLGASVMPDRATTAP